MVTLYRFLIVLIALSCVSQAQSQDYDFTATKAILDSYVKAGKLAGGVLVVTKDGETVLSYASGMQDIEANAAMKEDSIFRIASQTKALTSVAVMILQERGQLKLSDPLSKYIPAFANTTVMQVNEDKSFTTVPANRAITLHDLMTHSAGIGYGWGPNQSAWVEAGVFDWYFADKDTTMLEAVEAIALLPQDAQPGESFVYGHNTDILGAVVAKVSGMSLRQFFKKEIIQPLGMTDTDFIVSKDKLSRFNTVYNANSEKDGKVIRALNAEDAKVVDGAKNYMHTQGHYTDPNVVAFSGGAGLTSTAMDYTRFLMMLANGGELDGTRILSEESVAEMVKNQIPYIDMTWNDGFGYGFALKHYTHGEHKGKVAEYDWGGAYHTNYFVRPIDKVTFSYMTQLIPSGALVDHQQLRAVTLISMGIKP